LLGGCRDKVPAYASTFPNMGTIQDYADHALACKKEGYTHYKIHPYYFYDPVTKESDPGRPSHIAQDIEVCYAIRDAVGVEHRYKSRVAGGAWSAVQTVLQQAEALSAQWDVKVVSQTSKAVPTSGH
jgi:hypothetical protein